MEYSQDLVKGTFVPVILSLLKERAMYGYEIVKLVNTRTNGRLEWKEGTLYPILHRLQADGLVAAEWSQVTGTDRSRKYYRLTAKGAGELKRRAQEWREFSAAVNALIVGG
jgi:PadR family transcriptional regulator, regulatory protein PadR